MLSRDLGTSIFSKLPAIMHKGVVREIITSQDLIDQNVADDYTKELLSASL